MLEHIVDIFNEHIEVTSQCIQPLSPLIVETSEMLVQALLSDNKILCCGNGASGTIVQHFSTQLLNRFEQERPSLPALCLSNDTPTITAIATDTNFNEIYSKQIRALGLTGDILLALSPRGDANNLVQSISAARERNMVVIVLSGANGGDVASLLTPEDIELRVPAISNARIHEVHLLIVNILCELIDQQLFGLGT
jgi:D-sedoheptulose 7-phosphate isomerase